MVNRRSENKEKKESKKQIKTSPVKLGSRLIEDEGLLKKEGRGF